MFWVIFNLFSVPTFWFVMPILCLVCLLPDIVWDLYATPTPPSPPSPRAPTFWLTWFVSRLVSVSVMRTYFPSNYQVVQEIYRAEEEERKKRLAGAPQLTLQETA